MENIFLGDETNKQKKPKKAGLTPTQVLALGFASVIMIGALLLCLPIATVDGQGAPFLTAVFTATSAVCVTGLVVVDTGTYYTMFGQLIIMLMIQIGGLGFMTFATLFAIIMGRKITLKERILLQEALNQVSMEGIVRLAKYVIQITFVIEALGAVLLAVRWVPDFGWARGIYMGIFHAVSAFNNAGFDLFGEYRSITTYASDLIINSVIAILVIIGGLGFLVLSELYIEKGRKLHLHSQIVLHTSAWLIGIGAVVIFLLEFTNPATLGTLDPLGKILASIFQAITSRTAGFNSVPINELRDSTLLFIIILMFIGASPGSTGGGIKTTTFVTVFLSIIANFKGKCTVDIRERTLPADIVQKAITVAFSAFILIIFVTGLLTITEQQEFFSLLFEVTSAFGTVGLSTGITPTLTNFGKIAIMLTMFIGRVGPLTLAFALAQRAKKQKAQIKYPEERILIG